MGFGVWSIVAKKHISKSLYFLKLSEIACIKNFILKAFAIKS